MTPEKAYAEAVKDIEQARKAGVTELDLSHPYLKSLPPEIGKLENLQLLDLSFCMTLTSLPASIGNLTNLQRLDLDVNEIDHLPPEIGKLKKLRALYLKENRLVSLPAEIGNLVNLQHFHLHSNELVSLPAEIGRLVNLRELTLSQNKLTAIPHEIGQLKKLETLHLGWNQLTQMPSSLFTLSKLTTLTIDDDRMTRPQPIPVSFINQITDIHLRRALIDLVEPAKFIAGSDAKQIHRDETGILWRVKLKDGGQYGDDVAWQAVEIRNKIPEPDGSTATQFLPVPRFNGFTPINTARAAIAWTLDMSEEEYQPDEET